MPNKIKGRMRLLKYLYLKLKHHTGWLVRKAFSAKLGARMNAAVVINILSQLNTKQKPPVKTDEGDDQHSPDESWSQSIPTEINPTIRLGKCLLAFFVLGFGGWAAFAPLSAAIVSQGVVAASGKNQKIQHLEGGIISEISVSEGDHVEAGDVLLELDLTEPQSIRNRIKKQIISRKLSVHRLKTDCKVASEFSFPKALYDKALELELESLIEEQIHEHKTSCDVLVQESSILNQQLESFRQNLSGLISQKDSFEKKVIISDGEVRRHEKLLEQGLVRRSQVSELQMTAVDMLGQLGQTNSNILAATTKIAETEQQLARLKTKRSENIASELSNVLSQLNDLEEQLQTAEQVLKRTKIKATTSGLVVKLNHNAIGAVIRPGEEVLEILPTEESLVVEARIPTQNIDALAIGQKARLNFIALNQRTTPKVDATLSYISADRIVDDRTNEPYYSVRLKISDQLPSSFNKDQIYPGMPVETYITNGERTFFEYLLKPISDSFNRAFREK
ncbi:MAG: HlyD family type I secretion periplasmic adaptor subunit [Pseudomonadota bacterium]